MPPPTKTNPNKNWKQFDPKDTKESASELDMIFGGIGGPEQIPNLLKKGIEQFLEGKKPEKADSPYSEVYIQTKIAKEFGDGTTQSEWVKALDKEMSVASFYAVRALKTAHNEGKDLTWDFVVSLMNNADGLTQVPNSHKKVYDTFCASEGTNWFKFDGSATKTKINKIKSWFKKTVTETDPKVYENSMIVQNGVLDRLAKIASETGAKVEDFESLFSSHDERADKVLEIGIIRFPTKEDPYVKLFRMQIFAWFSSSRVLFVQNDQAGFDLELDVMHFKPVDAVVDRITEEQAEKVAEKLSDEDTFDF